MKKKDIEERTEQLVVPIIEENQFELVDVEYVKEGSNWYLRVYADKEEGITIDDCVLISRALEEKLDQEDFMKDPYILEVSSPGLGRQLKKDRDYLRSIGETVECKLYEPIEGSKDLTGILKAYDGKEITIETAEGNMLILEKKRFASVRLAIDF